MNSNSTNTVFSDQCHHINCCEEILLLHPQKVIFWPAQSAILVADIHLGKEHVFQRAGMAVPSGSSIADIEKLSALIELCQAKHLLILGDLLHAVPQSNEPWLLRLKAFFDLHNRVNVEVISGNHDRKAGQKILKSVLDGRINWHQKNLNLGPFTLQHEPPSEQSTAYSLCGHLHPTYRLSSSRRESLRAPAFWFTDNMGVLPSFGEFTGGHNIKPLSHHRVFFVGPNSVIPIQQHTVSAENHTL